MDGAIGLIRVEFDFSVWPVEGNVQSAGSRNIFTSPTACGGSTCIPWYEDMTSENVVTEVVSHVLNNLAVTAAEAAAAASLSGKSSTYTHAPTLKKEWDKVLRLALVVDHGSSSHFASKRNDPSSQRVEKNATSILAGKGGAFAGKSLADWKHKGDYGARAESLVLVNPSMPLIQQANVIQALHTGGRIQVLDTAIIVVPFDDHRERALKLEEEAVAAQKRREIVMKANTQELDRKMTLARSRDEKLKKKTTTLKSAFAESIDGDINEIASLVDQEAALKEKLEAARAENLALEEELKKETLRIEQDLARIDGRIDAFTDEKRSIESLLEEMRVRRK